MEIMNMQEKFEKGILWPLKIEARLFQTYLVKNRFIKLECSFKRGLNPLRGCGGKNASCSPRSSAIWGNLLDEHLRLLKVISRLMIELRTR